MWRTNSIFDNSELGARGLPEGGELALLEPHRDRLPPELFDTVYRAPVVEGEPAQKPRPRKATAGRGRLGH